LSLSHISIIASYGFVISVKNIADELLYSYLVSLMILSGLYWHFTFAALSRSAAALEESLSKVRKYYLRVQDVDIRNERRHYGVNSDDIYTCVNFL
jgi:hypothetical protein